MGKEVIERLNSKRKRFRKREGKRGIHTWDVRGREDGSGLKKRGGGRQIWLEVSSLGAATAVHWCWGCNCFLSHPLENVRVSQCSLMALPHQPLPPKEHASLGKVWP